jgi:hypothetical protein
VWPLRGIHPNAERWRDGWFYVVGQRIPCSKAYAAAAVRELERAVEWIRAADQFTKRYGCPFLFVYCRTLYGRVLIASGDWARLRRSSRSQ